jgi:sorting nexin-1/2
MGSSSNKPPRVFLIRIGDPTKVGLAAAAHIVYTVTTRVRLLFIANLFHNTLMNLIQTLAPHLAGRQDISVLRRFSDFLWLFNVLQASNPGVIVPPVPDKHPFGAYLFSRSSSTLAPSRPSPSTVAAFLSFLFNINRRSASRLLH